MSWWLTVVNPCGFAVTTFGSHTLKEQVMSDKKEGVGGDESTIINGGHLHIDYKGTLKPDDAPAVEQKAKKPKAKVVKTVAVQTPPSIPAPAPAPVVAVQAAKEKLRLTLSEIWSAQHGGEEIIMTCDAWRYYTAKVPGRDPFYCWARLDDLANFSTVLGHPLTLDDLRDIVAEDAVNRPGQPPIKAVDVCRRQLLAMKDDILAIERVKNPNLQRKDVVIQPNQLKTIEFVRVSAVTPFVSKKDELFDSIENYCRRNRDRQVSFLEALYEVDPGYKCWTIIGSIIRRRDGVEMPISGGMWFFQVASGRCLPQKSGRSLLVKTLLDDPDRAKRGFQLRPIARFTPDDLLDLYEAHQRATLQEIKQREKRVGQAVWSADADDFALNDYAAEAG